MYVAAPSAPSSIEHIQVAVQGIGKAEHKIPSQRIGYLSLKEVGVSALGDPKVFVEEIVPRQPQLSVVVLKEATGKTNFQHGNLLVKFTGSALKNLIQQRAVHAVMIKKSPPEISAIGLVQVSLLLVAEFISGQLLVKAGGQAGFKVVSWPVTISDISVQVVVCYPLLHFVKDVRALKADNR